MRLILLPAYPSGTDGYGIAVRSDLAQLHINDDDIIVWYVTEKRELPNNQYSIIRYSKYSYKRILNFMTGRPTTELLVSELKQFDLTKVDCVFCGEVIFYKALKRLFPKTPFTVRFHNCYARINNRVDLLGNRNRLSPLFRLNLKAFSKLEKEIFRDGLINKIFISQEDRRYYCDNFGKYHDSEVWGFAPNKEKMINNRCDIKHISKIIWYGGLDSHKIDSVLWFTNVVFPQIKAVFPKLEFHLYGKGTTDLNNTDNGVFGHGFYKGDGMPFKNEGLYINPDIIGGGVKIKLLSYFENGVTFLTSPFGYEGYPEDLIDNQYCFVKESHNWVPFLKSFLADKQ